MSSHDFIIIGSGIGGLAAAWELHKLGRRVLVIESRADVGGVVGGERVDGFLLEYGPNSFTSFPPDILHLSEEVGLGERAIKRPMSEHSRFVFRDGALRKVPGQAMSMGQFAGALRGALRSVPPPREDITVGAYFRARIGDAFVENLLKPFLAGVYAADADRVSFEATLPKIYNVLKNQNRLIVPALNRIVNKSKSPSVKRSLVSFPNGLGELPQATAAALRRNGVRIATGVTPTIEKHRDNWGVAFGDEVAVAPHVICATAAKAAGELLAREAPVAAEMLKGIPYAPLVIVHVGLREDQLFEHRSGFGFLTVDGHGVRMLGAIWSDRIFGNRAPQGHRLMTCFYGGEKDPEAMQWDDERLRAQLESDLHRTMGYSEGSGFRLLKITRLDRALPIFRLGHLDKMAKLRDNMPMGVELLGNYLGGVSMPDRVVAAKKLAAAIGKDEQ